ncbi:MULTISPECIES: hypothetical protein [Comamonadaceae]|jgi:hypothetical protein|uniref:Uncharacterized protein n=3 Tax=cellular organisms TaxID=131567 RepID=A0A420RSG2_GIBIN|nr:MULTISPECIES: hypothetical protein [Comamonadaceae]OJX31499.1 MAG: hypothetical protein BGO74_06095 [Burkholderiales bacterium 68-12]RKL19991.1 hypothetical protein BFJ72_g15111 [Fusarium proliferatum]GAO20869.1 proline-tRNA ligase [Alicycliphilus sp. B1]MDR7092879.1 hypothetical protein [Hydrogenophaga laconesensis]NCU65545.1 hypothetical protein [Acidovorax sp. 210-6]
MSIPSAIEGAMNLWNSVETALRAANPGASHEALFQATAEAMNQALGLGWNGTRVVFDDGTYSVRVSRVLATIAQGGGARFSVPAGHAWFDRCAQARTARAAEALYAELLALSGP